MAWTLCDRMVLVARGKVNNIVKYCGGDGAPATGAGLHGTGGGGGGVSHHDDIIGSCHITSILHHGGGVLPFYHLYNIDKGGYYLLTCYLMQICYL